MAKMLRSFPAAVRDLTYGCLRWHRRERFKVCVDNLKHTPSVWTGCCSNLAGCHERFFKVILRLLPLDT